MKKLLAVILALLVLGPVVPGCGSTHRYDGRLAAVDSLMKDNPDSALALVLALDTADILAEGDRAYRALLLTQARYRAYVTATSDSDINQALAYFRVHPADREKLTRAYIYKGAVMDELGHPDSAMLYYKHAEATAAPDDYFNQGYVKMRIASLYQDQLSQDSAVIIRLKQAIKCFEIVNDTNYLISCYGDLGAICGTKYPDSTEYYLINAIKLAQQYNPPKQYTYISKLAGFNLYYKKDYRLANQLAMDVINNGKDDCNERQFYYYAVWSYIELGLIDSAKYVFNLTPAPQHKLDSMNYFNIISKFEKIESHHELSVLNALNSADCENKIISSSEEKKLLKSDIEFDKRQIEKENAVLSKHNTSLFTIALMMITIVISLFTAIKLLQAIYRKRLQQLEKDREEIESSLSELEQKLKSSTGDITKYVSYRMSAIHELYQSIRVKKQSDGSEKKTIVPLSGFLKELNENNEILKLNLSETFWTKLKLSVNGEYNDIVTFIEQRFPNLNENDIKLFCLLCANISPQIIKLCMNYTSDKTSSTYRNRIIKKKMGLDMTFDKFIENYMKGRFNDL